MCTRNSKHDMNIPKHRACSSGEDDNNNSSSSSCKNYKEDKKQYQRQHGAGGDDDAASDDSNAGDVLLVLRRSEKQVHTTTPTMSLGQPNASPSEVDATDAAESQHEEILSGRNLGRGGDARMHQAVAARLADPSMTLMEALVKGGFRFPTNSTDDHSGGSSPPKIKLDEDGVQLNQRKNQLTRRLRVIRKKEEKTGDLGANISSVEIHRQHHQRIGDSTTDTIATANVSYLARHDRPPPEEKYNGANKFLDQRLSTLTGSSILPSVPSRNVNTLQQIAKNGPTTRTLIGTRNHNHRVHSSTAANSMAESLLNQDILQNTDYRQNPFVFSSAAEVTQRRKRSVEEMSGTKNLADIFIAVGKKSHQQNQQQQQQQQLLFQDVIRNDHHIPGGSRGLLPTNHFFTSNSSAHASSSMIQSAAPPPAAVQDANVKHLLGSLGLRISGDDSRNSGATLSNGEAQILDLLNLRQQVRIGQQSKDIQEPRVNVLHPSQLLSHPSSQGLGTNSMGGNRLMFDAAGATGYPGRNSSSSRRAGIPVLDTTIAPNVGATNALVRVLLSSCEGQLSLAVDIYAQQRRGLILNCLKAAGFADNMLTSSPEVIDALIRAFEMKISSNKKARKSW